jgi:hypothetical protein
MRSRERDARLPKGGAALLRYVWVIWFEIGLTDHWCSAFGLNIHPFTVHSPHKQMRSGLPCTTDTWEGESGSGRSKCTCWWRSCHCAFQTELTLGSGIFGNSEHQPSRGCSCQHSFQKESANRCSLFSFTSLVSYNKWEYNGDLLEFLLPNNHCTNWWYNMLIETPISNSHTLAKKGYLSKIHTLKICHNLSNSISCFVISSLVFQAEHICLVKFVPLNVVNW